MNCSRAPETRHGLIVAGAVPGYAPPMPTARPHHVSLRSITRDDLAVLYQHETDPESGRLAGVKPRSRDAFIAHWERVITEERAIERAILADGVLAGRVACFEAEHDGHPTWMLGYWIGREHWGRGVASSAVGLFLAEIDRRPLLARVLATNAASIRILERHGFARTAETHEPETERYTAGLVLDFRLD